MPRSVVKRHRVAFDELCLGLKRQWVGRPFQGASLDGTSPRAKARGLFC